MITLMKAIDEVMNERVDRDYSDEMPLESNEMS